MPIGISRDHLALIYTIGVFGAFLQIAGGDWDVSSHIAQAPETFFTPQHLVLYTGIAVGLVASGLGLLLRLFGLPKGSPARPLLTGLTISAVGGAFQVVAGPFDFWWHDNFGFDPHLFTPSHTLLILGIVLVGFGMALGALRLLQAHRAGIAVGTRFATTRWLELLAVVSLAALWLHLNGLVYLLTDVAGMAYTFNLGPGFVSRTGVAAFVIAVSALAATGTLVLFTAKRVLPWKGAVTAVASLVTATVAVAVLLNYVWYFRGTPEAAAYARYVPLHFAFLVPIVAFDVWGTEGRTRAALAWAAAIGPFVSFLDGFHGSNLWTQSPGIAMLLVVPTLVVGLCAGLSRVRFANLLSLPAGVPGVPQGS